MRAAGARYTFTQRRRCILTLRLTPKPSSIEVMFCEGSTVEVGNCERKGRFYQATGGWCIFTLRHRCIFIPRLTP